MYLLAVRCCFTVIAHLCILQYFTFSSCSMFFLQPACTIHLHYWQWCVSCHLRAQTIKECFQLIQLSRFGDFQKSSCWLSGQIITPQTFSNWELRVVNISERMSSWSIFGQTATQMSRKCAYNVQANKKNGDPVVKTLLAGGQKLHRVALTAINLSVSTAHFYTKNISATLTDYLKGLFFIQPSP